jgi:hypothetical protein
MSDLGIDLLKTLDRPIAFHRAFMPLTGGSAKAALLLSYAVSSTAGAGNTDGYFWKSAEQWERATGMTRRQLYLALKGLRKKGIGAASRRPGSRFGPKGLIAGHISLNWSELGALDTADDQIAFHPAFFALTGSIDAALMLSHAVCVTELTPDGWFQKTVKQWREETGLDHPAQNNGAAILRKNGLLLIDKKRVPRRVCYRVDTEKLQEDLQQMPMPAKSVGHV